MPCIVFFLVTFAVNLITKTLCGHSPVFMLAGRPFGDLHNIAFEQAPINKQLQERKTYQTELLYNGEAFNF